MHKYKDCIPALDTAFLWVFSALQWDLLEPFWSGDVPLCLLWGSIIQVTFCRSAFHPQIVRSGLRSVNRNNAAASSAARILKKKFFTDKMCCPLYAVQRLSMTLGQAGRHSKRLMGHGSAMKALPLSFVALTTAWVAPGQRSFVKTWVLPWAMQPVCLLYCLTYLYVNYYFLSSLGFNISLLIVCVCVRHAVRCPPRPRVRRRTRPDRSAVLHQQCRPHV